MPKAEIEKPSDMQYVVDALKSGAISFGEFTDEFVDFVDSGGALIEPDKLEGIPFGILGVTYREGYVRAIKGQTLKGDYASLEVLIADEKALDESGVDWRNRGIKPLDVRILNDGGTGIRRQITGYLHTRSYAQVTASAEEAVVAAGKLGESDFDVPFANWISHTRGTLSKAQDETNVYELQFDRMVIANRGTRFSEYENPAKKGEIIKTWYLA